MTPTTKVLLFFTQAQIFTAIGGAAMVAKMTAMTAGNAAIIAGKIVTIGEYDYLCSNHQTDNDNENRSILLGKQQHRCRFLYSN